MTSSKGNTRRRLVLIASLIIVAISSHSECLRAEESKAPPTSEEGTSNPEERRQKLQIAFLGTLDLDQGERNSVLSVALDWMVRSRLLVHGSLFTEERVSAFRRTDSAIGAGYLIERGSASFPVWAGAGTTVTGLWGHALSRGSLRFGLGYRHHATARVAFAVNQDVFIYDRDRTRTVTTFGVVYVIR